MVSRAEDALITEALNYANGNQGVAARLLGVSATQVLRRLETATYSTPSALRVASSKAPVFGKPCLA